MDELKALIHNYNLDCYKQYTTVSPYLGDKLDDSLKEIERFFYSDFWTSRFVRRLREEGFRYYPLELDCILGTITCLREDTKFKLFDADPNESGISNKDTMIALNINMKELTDSHIKNIIMHEFGHRQYNQPEFVFIKYLNELAINHPGLYIKDNEVLSKVDYSYFTDDNELRQRIIPIIKEMYDNDWTAENAYEQSHNLYIDDIKNIFTKEYIIELLNNLL